MTAKLVTDLRNVRWKDVATVGGKNAWLGELMNTLEGSGVRLPAGFGITAAAYWHFLERGDLRGELIRILAEIDPSRMRSTEYAAKLARNAVLSRYLPEMLIWEMHKYYDLLTAECGGESSLAVRSSATAEGLPGAEFPGQHRSFLNVRGKEELVVAVHHCYASLFTERAIGYRIRKGFDHFKVALSVGVQQMVRSDVGAAGVIFTYNTESGFGELVLVSGSYGLGQTFVQESAKPDEWTVLKPNLAAGSLEIAYRRLGTKETQLIFEANSGGTRLVEVNPTKRSLFCLSDAEVQQLAKWACDIEDHYYKKVGQHQPMEIEWAKDGLSGELFVLQARANELDPSPATPALRPGRLGTIGAATRKGA